MGVRPAFQPLLVALLLAVGAAWLLRPDGRTVEGFAQVIDGDSLEVGSVEIRLRGLDAPELQQTCTRHRAPYACGEASRAALAELVAGQSVRCRGSGRDHYQRLLARCFIQDQDVGAWLVAQGYAVGYGSYESEQDRARQAALGLWAGQFDQPDYWRQRFARP
jgi:endonuclease YncB( thermonuclease family)